MVCAATTAYVCVNEAGIEYAYVAIYESVWYLSLGF